MGLAEILNRNNNIAMDVNNDDINVVRSFVEYSQDNKVLRYMIYEVDMMDTTGELRHFYKVIKLTRIIRLPKNAKQSVSFMDIVLSIDRCVLNIRIAPHFFHFNVNLNGEFTCWRYNQSLWFLI